MNPAKWEFAYVMINEFMQSSVHALAFKLPRTSIKMLHQNACVPLGEKPITSRLQRWTCPVGSTWTGLKLVALRPNLTFIGFMSGSKLTAGIKARAFFNAKAPVRMACFNGDSLGWSTTLPGDPSDLERRWACSSHPTSHAFEVFHLQIPSPMMELHWPKWCKYFFSTSGNGILWNWMWHMWHMWHQAEPCALWGGRRRHRNCQVHIEVIEARQRCLTNLGWVQAASWMLSDTWDLTSHSNSHRSTPHQCLAKHAQASQDPPNRHPQLLWPLSSRFLEDSCHPCLVIPSQRRCLGILSGTAVWRSSVQRQTCGNCSWTSEVFEFPFCSQLLSFITNVLYLKKHWLDWMFNDFEPKTVAHYQRIHWKMHEVKWIDVLQAVNSWSQLVGSKSKTTARLKLTVRDLTAGKSLARCRSVRCNDLSMPHIWRFFDT